jgi:hypothetical protein
MIIKEVFMLDIEFLRSLGIREDRLPKANGEEKERDDNDGATNLPVELELIIPIELMELSGEELKSLIVNNHSQDNPYTYRTPHAHTIAVYPNFVPCGPYDLEFTVDEFLVMLFLIKILGGRPTAYKTHQGSWVSW